MDSTLHPPTYYHTPENPLIEMRKKSKLFMLCKKFWYFALLKKHETTSYWKKMSNL